MEEGGRKTRNSNGVRLSAHPRLRNGKAFSKSDSDDDEDDEEEGQHLASVFYQHYCYLYRRGFR